MAQDAYQLAEIKSVLSAGIVHLGTTDRAAGTDDISYMTGVLALAQQISVELGVSFQSVLRQAWETQGVRFVEHFEEVKAR